MWSSEPFPLVAQGCLRTYFKYSGSSVNVLFGQHTFWLTYFCPSSFSVWLTYFPPIALPPVCNMIPAGELHLGGDSSSSDDEMI
jgi:hypothetical protein